MFDGKMQTDRMQTADTGRTQTAEYTGCNADQRPASCVQITWEDLKAAEEAVGEFGGDNRAGVQVNLRLKWMVVLDEA